ncbi:hypothetical protein DFJ58DRAFT_790651 [Suillus subalutaceus]|uniref:uncharacterized protein n=1 Tax=Suillus subalutaceus TaxID=48586 RepID=UPI001B866DB7|nr:uncharacterized protein DFJ58DRAFT_790651 [Suillus subalutaceus]KAG1852804.1 hypothetical protein DFJ58DRAFT_790651 [Suillus subalutaceus]
MDRERYDSRQHSVSSTPTSQHSSHRSRSPYTSDSQSSMSPTSGISPRTPQRPFYRSPAPGPSDNLVRYRAPSEPFPQSPLYSHGPHDNLDGTAFLYDRSPGSSQSAQSSSSDTQSHFDSNQLIPPFQLTQIREKVPHNLRVDGSRALSTSSSMAPAASGPSGGPRGRTVSSGDHSQYIAPLIGSQQMPSNVMIQGSRDSKTSMLADGVLMAAISAANAEHREFPWYCVWTRALERHTFPSSIGDDLFCNVAPQHVLIRSFDPSPPDSLSPGRGRSGGSRSESVSPFISEPRTPPRRTQAKVRHAHVVPDFAQILRRIKLPPSMPPVIVREKVICLISRQAYFAFMGDSTLTTIGVILAFGNVWKYVEFPRPLANLPSTWSEYQDPTFGSPSSLRRPVPRVPSYLKKLSGNKDYIALKFLATRILEREKDI